MNKLTLDFEGLPALEQELALLSRSEGRTVMRRSARAGARVIQKEAQRRAKKRSGKLRRNIAVANGESTNTRATAGVTVREEGKASNARNAFYWRFVEFGTRNAPAAPFIRPAFDTKEDEAVEAAEAEIIRDIDRVLRR